MIFAIIAITGLLIGFWWGYDYGKSRIDPKHLSKRIRNLIELMDKELEE